MIRPLLLLAFLACSLAAQTPFSVDSAAAYLKTLAVNIGARPMGSPNERRAIEFALGKFREFGLDEAYMMPIRSAISQPFSTPVNTSTGVAVGVLHGASNRIIVIGGHIDSAEPDIPGANDDGSGTAVVLELARVFAQQKIHGQSNQSTLVFALFGGEEKGFVGSKHFVDYFDNIDDVALMLQVDMANGSDMLTMFLDTYKHSAPEWLVRAAYEEFDKLGYSGLTYPTHFFTLNSTIPGGGVGSDHQPFLDYGIPAIDFTSDPNDPIHTLQDTYENFTLSGLKRSGDLVYKLAERFDGGVPEEKTGNYFLYDTGVLPLFFPLWTVSAFIVLSISIAIFAWIVLRRRFLIAQDQDNAIGEIRRKDSKIPGLKLFLLMLIIQTCVWLSENIVGFLKGVRFPWWADLTGYFILGFLASVLGIWLSLQLISHLQLSRNASRYFLRAVIILTFFTAVFSLSSATLAFYPASGLFLLSLAMLIRQSAIRIVLWFTSAHFMFHLVFSEGFGLIAHSFIANPRSLPASIVLHLLYILFFALWSFPFLLGFAALRCDANVDYFWLKRFRTRAGLLVSGAMFAIWIAVLVFQPTFSNLWKQEMTVQQTVDHNANTNSIVLSSNDNLDGTQVHFVTEDGARKDTALSGWITEARLHQSTLTDEPWISVERTIEKSPSTDITTHIEMTLTVRTRSKPYTLSVTYTSPTGEVSKPYSPFSFSSTEHTMTIQWYSFPDTLLVIPLAFSTANDARVIESIEAVFVEPYTPVTVQKDNANTRLRTKILKTSTIQ